MGTKIRIGNLPPETENSSLEDLLTMVGDIYTLRFVTENDMKTAYVEMMSATQAKDCIDRFDKRNFRGSVLSVREDIVMPVRKARVASRR